MIIKKKNQLDSLKRHHSLCEACGEAKQLHFSCQQCITILSHRSITRVPDIRLKTPTLKSMQLP